MKNVAMQGRKNSFLTFQSHVISLHIHIAPRNMGGSA